MWWILVVVSQLIVIAGGIQSERRARLWSWSKFVFALAFAALEVIIVTVPLYLVDLHGRWFVPIMSIAGIVAALNFVWFIVIARRGDFRTAVPASRPTVTSMAGTNNPGPTAVVGSQRRPPEGTMPVARTPPKSLFLKHPFSRPSNRLE